MARRSVLFSPGHRPDMLRKATEAGADVLAFDLEDAVPPAKRRGARNAVVDCLADETFTPNAEVCIRINRGEEGVADIQSFAASDRLPDAIMLPKVTGAAEITEIADTLVEHVGRSLPIFAMVEQATGVEAAPSIASQDATTALVLGAEDLSAELRATITEDLHTLSYARQRLVVAATIGGVDAIDTPYTNFRDQDGLHRQASTARSYGYVGKLAIHPAQVDPIHSAFRPDSDAIEWARRVLQASEEAGGGVFELDGTMVDAPVLARAEHIIRQAGEDSDRRA